MPETQVEGDPDHSREVCFRKMNLDGDERRQCSLQASVMGMYPETRRQVEIHVHVLMTRMQVEHAQDYRSSIVKSRNMVPKRLLLYAYVFLYKVQRLCPKRQKP